MFEIYWIFLFKFGFRKSLKNIVGKKKNKVQFIFIEYTRCGIQLLYIFLFYLVVLY